VPNDSIFLLETANTIKSAAAHITSLDIFIYSTRVY
jgi:hypothetical protein